MADNPIVKMWDKKLNRWEKFVLSLCWQIYQILLTKKSKEKILDMLKEGHLEVKYERM